MTQLTDKIREALLGNVGTIICGRIGVTDADLMVKAFTPTFTAEDLTKTPNHAAIAKVMMFDMPSAPFTINLPPPMGDPNDKLLETLKVYSATRYAKTRSEVEKEIEARWNAATAGPAPQKASTRPPEASVSASTPKPPVLTTSAGKASSSASPAPTDDDFLSGWLGQKSSRQPAPAPAPSSASTPAPSPTAPATPTSSPTSASPQPDEDQILRIR